MMIQNYQRMQHPLIVKEQRSGVQWLTKCRADRRVKIDTVFVCVYICNATAEPESVWNAQDAVDCNCSNLTLYLSAALRCDRAKITRFLGSNTGHSRSRHFDFSVGPDSARNFSGVATFGVDCHAAADAQVALKQK